MPKSFFINKTPPPPTTVLCHCPAFKNNKSYFFPHPKTTLPTPRFFALKFYTKKWVKDITFKYIKHIYIYKKCSTYIVDKTKGTMVISAHKRDKNDIYFIFTQETIHPRCPPRCPLLVHLPLSSNNPYTRENNFFYSNDPSQPFRLKKKRF